MQWLAWAIRRLLGRPQPFRIASHETRVWNPPPPFSREALSLVTQSSPHHVTNIRPRVGSGEVEE